MKRSRLLLILLFVFPIVSYAGNDDEVDQTDSSIEQVLVFRNGAQVTRNATVTLSPGRNEIQFTGLTSSLNSQTIQLSGSGEFMILSLTHRQEYLEEHPQKERLQEPTTQRDSLQRLIENKETTVKIVDREINILMSNSNLKGDQQNLLANELKQAMEYFHSKLTELENQKLDLNREITNMQAELEKIKKQISELNSNAPKNTSVITAVLQSESETQADLTLTYLVSNAGWYPSYDLRVSDIDSPMNLSYKANVYQSTGIDWNDVRLTVSSAIPERGGTLPQLNPWYLQFVPPQPEEAEAMGFRSSNQDEAVISAARQKSENQPVPVSQTQNQTSFSYQINLPYDVPSGGKRLTVEINNNDLAADYRYMTVPKLRNQAYLTAQVGEWSQYHLLPGEANLFFENTYVGKSQINPNSVGDTLAFPLGRDESIVTERKKLEEFEERNFFGNRVTESFAWEISVRNTKDMPVKINVEDQIPVSQNEDIEVSLNESSGADYNQQTGMLSWELQLPPGETKTLRFDYEVEYPKGRQVNF